MSDLHERVRCDAFVLMRPRSFLTTLPVAQYAAFRARHLVHASVRHGARINTRPDFARSRELPR